MATAEDTFCCNGGIIADGSGIPEIDNKVKCPCVGALGSDNFVKLTGDSKNTICNCDFSVPLDVPIKTLLKATTMSPWVRIAFQKYCSTQNTPCNVGECDSNELKRSIIATEQTIITTGNISQPIPETNEFGSVLRCVDQTNRCCRASIKAFQYGWGSVDSGNRCRVTIVDELGGSFAEWADRIVKNTESASHRTKGVYNMKVQFGWFISGGDENDVCGQPTAEPGATVSAGQNTSNTICSPVLWFLPDWINVSYQGNKFIYELEGVDLLVRGQENVISKTFGRDGKKKHFVDAVRELGRISQPAFCVDFLQSNPKTNGQADITPLKFKKREGCNEDSETLGPFDKWVAYERTPLAIVNEWLRRGVQAQGDGGKGIGITVNYDSVQDCETDGKCACNSDALFFGLIPNPNAPDKGRMVLWKNGIPTCQSNFTESQSDSLLKGVYLVNGGSCSPVYSFNPSIRWNFQAAAVRGGGSHIPLTGKVQKQSEGFAKSKCGITGGTGPSRVTTVPDTNMMVCVRDPKSVIQETTALHMQANILAHSIEAELRIQGDPSIHFCTPVAGYGRALGIVFINPFFLDRDTSLKNNCPEWKVLGVEFDSSGNLTSSDKVCNQILTNKGWFIKGVDHQIRDNNYITTVKLVLPVPGADLLANEGKTITGFGAWAGGFVTSLGGTFSFLQTVDDFFGRPIGNFAANLLEIVAPEGGCLRGQLFRGFGQVLNAGTKGATTQPVGPC